MWVDNDSKSMGNVNMHYLMTNRQQLVDLAAFIIDLLEETEEEQDNF